jgi:hypothetical protein
VQDMSSYCDTCDNTMRDTTAYLVGGERFNYCNECVEENGYQGREMITNAEIEGFFFGVPEGTIPLERIEKVREICRQPKPLTGPYCGDHLDTIDKCGCKI